MNPRLRVLAVVPLLALPLGLGGCVAAFFKQPVNVEVTRDEVEAMRREQSEMLALVRDLKSQMDTQTEATASMRADTMNQLRDLEERLEILRSQLEEQGVRSEKLQRRVQETKPPVSAPQAGFPGPDGADTTAAGSTGVETPTPAESRPPASETELYDAAYRDYMRGSYQLAIGGFEDFLKYYPQSDRADNAQYWIGECYFALGELDRAVQEFLKVRDLYPDGNKVCAATLKIGYAFLRKGNGPDARRYFELVGRECPGTDEARLAQDKLDTLR